MLSEQRARWARVRVSVTAVVALMILATLFYLLTGGTLFRPTTYLQLYIADATGIAPGSPVRVDGVDVGRVVEVALTGSTEPNRIVHLKLKIDEDRLPSITADSTAQPTSDTLVGDKVIQISSGRSQERIAPGGEIAFKPSADLTKGVDLAQFRKDLDAMDQLLTDIEQGRTPLGEFVSGDQMYSDLSKKLAELDRSLHTAVASTTTVGGALYSDVMYRKISDPIRRLDESLARLQSGQGTAGQWLRDTGPYDSLRAQIVQLRASIADTRKMEAITSDEAYRGWDRMLAGLIQKTDEFQSSSLLTGTAQYEQLNGMAKELQKTVREFREDPQKFLRLKVF